MLKPFTCVTQVPHVQFPGEDPGVGACLGLRLQAPPQLHPPDNYALVVRLGALLCSGRPLAAGYHGLTKWLCGFPFRLELLINHSGFVIYSPERSQSCWAAVTQFHDPGGAISLSVLQGQRNCSHRGTGRTPPPPPALAPHPGSSP